MAFLIELLIVNLTKKELQALDEVRKGTRLTREAVLKKAVLQIAEAVKAEQTIERVKERNAKLDQKELMDDIDEALGSVRSRR